jgi:hypothetical protein
VNPTDILKDALAKKIREDVLSTSVAIATWGLETAENKWGDVDAVIFVTTNELPPDAVYVQRIDQMQDPLIETNNADLRRMTKSEKANQILQAIGRGGRTIVDGKAAKLDAYVFSIDCDVLKPFLTKALHNVKTVKYLPITDGFKRELPISEQAFVDLKEYLSETEINEASVKSIWVEIDHQGTYSLSTRKRAINKITDDGDVPWSKLEGTKSLIRNGTQ